MSEESHAAAFKAALAAVNASPYDVGNVPPTLPYRYTEVTVTRRFGGNRRGDGMPTVTLYRATTRFIAKSVSDARELRRRAGLVENQSLSVDGEMTTPVEFETEEPIGPDNGWHSGLTTWTWAL